MSKVFLRTSPPKKGFFPDNEIHYEMLDTRVPGHRAKIKSLSFDLNYLDSLGKEVIVSAKTGRVISDFPVYLKKLKFKDEKHIHENQSY